MKGKIFLAAIFVLCSQLLWAQQESFVWNENSNGINIEEFILAVEKKTGAYFFYYADWLKDVRVVQGSVPADARSILKETLALVRLDLVEVKQNYFVVIEERKSDSQNVTERDQFHTLSGIIRNSGTGKGISQATLFFPSLKKEIVTAADGSFEIRLPEGHHLVIIESPGYAQIQRSVRLYLNMNLEIEMYDKLIELQEVEVSATSMQQYTSLEMGSVQISTESLKMIPPLLGERDVIRSILSMPGVKTVGEGASGFNVRGGNVDQNLILIDNAPLFNSSHLFGLFSVIDSDNVKSVGLHKGAMPARYGGRLSSVLDIEFLDNLQLTAPTLEGSVGFISSKLKVAVPLVKDKTAISFSSRAAYPDWILSMVPDEKVKDSRAAFYDGTLKISHRINDKNIISYTGHYSKDKFRFGADTTYQWSGLTSSLQYSTRISDHTTGELSAFYSTNVNTASAIHTASGFKLESSIENYGLRYDLNLKAMQHHDVTFGLETSVLQVNRGTIGPAHAASSVLNRQTPKEKGIESAVYVSDALELNSFLSVSAGIRLSNFLYLSNGIRNVYATNAPRNEFTFIEQQNVTSGTIERSFFNIEPRVAVKIDVADQAAVKLGVSRNFQYLSLLSNSAAISPMDTWKLTDSHLQPQQSDLISLGYFRTFAGQSFELSFETYYKIFSNIMQYKQGARLVMNDNIEQELLQGEGKSYGAEMYVKKNTGKLTGWLSYTYSRTLVRVKGDSDEETLSEGKFFPGNFDKPHDLGIVANYAFKKRLSISGNFVYNTGRPITYPESIYVMDGFLVANYSLINQERAPAYHRLDLTVTHTMLPKKSRKFETSWSLGAYNVYARRNPYSIFFQPSYSGRYPQAYRLSVLGSIIPYFTLNFKLK